jgi:hypothetical protein
MHTFTELAENERNWVALQLDAVKPFVATYSPDDAAKPLTLAILDRAFSAWLATDEADTQLINGAINCVGVAFGQFLVDGANLSWTLATDQQGTDLAVRGQPGKGDVLVYPANFVAKRWERHEANFLETSYQSITAQIAAISNHGEQKKPWWKFW